MPDQSLLPPLPERVALLFGGVSPEHEVSISSASQVTKALAELVARVGGLKVETVYINKDGDWVWRVGTGAPLSEEEIKAAPRWDLAPQDYPADVYSFPRGLEELVSRRIDAALLILHGANGEDGRLQGALDMAGVPYTGSGAMASALCMNKPRTQAVLNAARLPIAPSLAIRDYQQFDAGQIVGHIGLPMVVKPAQAGSSVGMTIVREAEQLPEALERAFQVDEEAIIESFVKGREFTAGVLEQLDGNGGIETIGLPIVEIVPPDGRFFDYDAKYSDTKTREIVPAPIDEKLASMMRTLAVRTHQACGCHGYSRVDFICDVDAETGEGQPVILEINTLPGMTARSLLPQAAAVAGIDYPSLIGVMLSTANHG